MKNATLILGVCIALLMSTGVGFLAGTRLAYKREMLEIQDRVATNAALSARCVEIACDEELQRLFVSSTDIAMHMYDDMERTLNERWLLGTYEVSAANVLTRHAVDKSIRTSEQLRKMFAKQGCGIDGRLCTKQTS